MAVFTIVLLVLFLGAGEFSYEAWAGLYAQQWFKLFAFVTFMSLYYHAWVGARHLMDYVKPVAVRLLLQVLTILWLVGCAGWTVQILWRV